VSVIGIELDPDQMVLTKGRDFKWGFENLDANGASTAYPSGSLYFQLDTGGQHNAKQEVHVMGATGGTYRLGVNGVYTSPIDFYDVTTAPHDIGGDITSALVATSTVGAGNVKVHPARLFPEWVISITLNTGNNEKQLIKLDTHANGGTFRVGYGLSQSGNIAFGCTDAVLKTALEGLSGIGTGNVSVVKLDNWNYQIEFINAKAAMNMEQVSAFGWGFGYGLAGGFLLNCTTSTIQNGTARLTESFVNTLNKTVNDVFNTFETLLGVNIDYVVTSQTNVVLTVTSLRAYTESDALTFAVDVTANLITGFLNNVVAFVGLSKTIAINFYWNHIYQVEFIGNLANTPVPAIVPDIASLTGVAGKKKVTVDVIAPGKARYTKWPFTIAGSTASLKVESEEVDKIQNRTHWQLAFLPTGETAGGDPIARGTVKVQE